MCAIRARAYVRMYISAIATLYGFCYIQYNACAQIIASVPGLPRYAVLLASVNCARAGHTENGEGLG